MIAVCRLRYCERTRAYAERRTAEGKTKTEIIRCLKRYIARELYHALIADLRRSPPPPRPPARPSPSPAAPDRSDARSRHLTSIGTSQPGSECWRPAFARYLYPAFTALRRDLDTYLHYYNTDRVHHGRLTRGRIPADIVDGARKMEAR